jgi:glutathione peroxidase
MVAAAAMAGEGAYVLDHKFKDIDGKDVDLEKYKGKVVLMVNTASQCGLTPQYKDLQALYDKYAAKGLSIVGFPANNFGSQEPGTESEIKEFCLKNYGVKFDMMSKSSVKGDDTNDVFKELTGAENGEFAGEIKWNFTKFLVGKDGKVIARFEPRTAPNDPSVTAAIEKALSS